MILSRGARSGTYAEQRYRQGLQRWRVRNRWLFAGLCGPLVAAGAVVGVLDGNVVAWCAGMVAGAFLALWVVLRDTPPRYVEKWLDGAEGEHKTEKTLRPLERAGWRIVHDVENDYGNYDHIAVSGAGVFLLESKNLQGIVELRDGVPHLQRRLAPEEDWPWEAIPRRARGAAAGLKEDVERRTGHRTWVQAVVVFWSDFPEGFVEDGKCVFIHGSRLRDWMQDRPSRLSQTEAKEIAAAIASIAAPESSPYAALGPTGSRSQIDADGRRGIGVASRPTAQ